MDDQKSQSDEGVSASSSVVGGADSGAVSTSKVNTKTSAGSRTDTKVHKSSGMVNSKLFSAVISPDAETEVTEVDSAKSQWNRPGVSDGVVRGNQAVPKAMQMGASMKLHSHLAINMFRGRRGDPAKGQRPIIGLARFARQVSLVWSAAEQDDPYADQSLIEVERVHDEAKGLLSGREKTLGELISGMEGLTVGLQTSIQPASIDLQFYCPWSYRAALLLLQFDRIVRLGLTAKHVGFIGDEEWKGVVSDSGRALRHLFAIPNHWINTGATRDDLRKNTKVAKRAIAMYNDVKEGRLVLSDDVLSGNTRAALAPQNRALEKFLAKSKQEVATN